MFKESQVFNSSRCVIGVYEVSLFILFISVLDDCFQESVEDKKSVFTDNCFMYCTGAKNSCDLLQLPAYVYGFG